MYLAFIRAESLPIKGEMFDDKSEQEQKHNTSMKYWLIKNGIPMSIGDFKIPYDPGQENSFPIYNPTRVKSNRIAFRECLFIKVSLAAENQ